MSIFHDPIVITLSVVDTLVYLQTYDPKHSWSQRFFLMKDTLSSRLSDDAVGCVTECDLLNVCSVSRVGNNIHFILFWLSGCYDDELHGYQQKLYVPVDIVARALAGERIKYLSYSPQNRDKAELFFTRTAHEAIAAQGKLKRHAFRKFLRDHFDYSRKEKLVIQKDGFVDGFYFFSTVSSYDGGIVPHETEVRGKDGKPHRMIYFGLHT